MATKDQVVNYAVSKAVADMTRQLSVFDSNFATGLISYIVKAGADNGPEAEKLAKAQDAAMKPINDLARTYRSDWRKLMGRQAPTADMAKAVAKAELDVGTLTNFASITGGQTLGYVSLDTRLARGTVRPSSFTLYQHLNKSAAKQVVDYWPYADSTGGALPGAAFSGYSSVGTGTLATNAGSYSLQNITLKLAVDGRAITTALAAQNSFVNVAEQETTNAALSILSSLNWACYFGNPTLYTNQFQGLNGTIPAANKFDFQEFYATGPATSEGWSKSLTMFNLIYEAAGQITSYGQFGHITHAFMSPRAMGGLEGLTQQQLNNILNEFSAQQGRSPIWDNGNLMGMRTRFGDIQFPLDLFITARDIPAMAIIAGGVSQATTSINSPTSVTGTASAAVPGSKFTTTFAPTSGATYYYAVAAMDANMNESNLTYTAAITGVAANGGITLTITPNGTSQAAYRIYRSSLNATSAQASGSPVGNGVRFIGEIAANAGSAVTFTDINAHIPGSESVFLLDLDDNDFALDYRYLLPISKIELFAQNLFMPWAVAAIGSIRATIPKFHGLIYNYVPENPTFDPLVPSLTAG